MFLFHFGCSFNQSFSCIGNLPHVQTYYEVCNWCELISDRNATENMCVFVKQTPFDNQWHLSKSKHFALLLLNCLIIGFSEYQLVPSSTAKFPKDRCVGSFPLSVESIFLFEVSKQNCRLHLLIVLHLFTGKQDQGLCVSESCDTDPSYTFSPC